MLYTLIRSRNRHRSLSLRVTPQGELIVRSPVFTPKLFIDHFVKTKDVWIKQQLTKKTQSPTRPTPHFTTSRLQAYIHEQVKHYSPLLHLTPSELKFKSVKSYWGNCTSSGRLTFNLNLRYAPPSAVEYVVVHELVHLKHKGHGKRFWTLVNQTFTQAKQARLTLRHLQRTAMPQS